MSIRKGGFYEKAITDSAAAGGFATFRLGGLRLRV
jgi:hypothetical protein